MGGVHELEDVGVSKLQRGTAAQEGGVHDPLSVKQSLRLRGRRGHRHQAVGVQQVAVMGEDTWPKELHAERERERERETWMI